MVKGKCGHKLEQLKGNFGYIWYCSIDGQQEPTGTIATLLDDYGVLPKDKIYKEPGEYLKYEK